MTEYRKLRRQKAIVAGVCGGLGVFFGLNPKVVIDGAHPPDVTLVGIERRARHVRCRK